MSDHTSKQFDAEMEAIRSGVLSMGGLVETQMTRAIEALEQDEDSHLIDAVGADEREINQLQIHIDQQCAQIIARRQPTAVDLRMILTVTQDRQRPRAHRRRDQEDRVQGGERSSGSDRLTRIRFFDVVRVAGGAQQMLRMALDAFARLDVERRRAKSSPKTTTSTLAFNAIMRQLISFMMEDPRTISAALEVVFIAKSIERIGDHAKNISESVVQAVKGKDVRHASAQQIRAEVSGE